MKKEIKSLALKTHLTYFCLGLFMIYILIAQAVSLLVTGCYNGTYGYDCTNNCSGHCLNNSPCDKQTGHCDGGCKPGYSNDDCSKGKSKYQFLYIRRKKRCSQFQNPNASSTNLLFYV